MKKRKNQEKGTRGAVSVFLAIILVPCIIISSVFVDVGRVQLSKTVAESSADLALNSLLTNYDADLKEWYGMIASCQNIEQFYEASAKYFVRTLQSQGLADSEIILISDYYSAVTGDDSIYDLLQVEAQTESAKMISEVSGANLSNAALIKDQVIEFMKYRAPIEIATTLFERLKQDPTVKDSIDAEINEPLVTDKQEFYESEGKLISASYESYKAIKKYYVSAGTTLNNKHLEETYRLLGEYKNAYEKMLSITVKYLTNTSGLTSFGRPKITNEKLNDYIDQYSNPGRNFKDVYSEKKKDEDDVEVYYIDLSDVRKLANQLSTKVSEFRTAITNFENAAKGVKDNLPYHMTEDNKSNTMQWWAKAHKAIVTDGHKEAVQNAGNAMMKAYAKVLAIDACTLRGTVPQGWNSLNDWKSKYSANTALNDAFSLYGTYLTVHSGTSNTYLKVVKAMEDASVNLNKKNAASHSVTINGSSMKITDAVSHISTKLNERRAFYQKNVDLLKIAINGDGKKIPSLDSLATLVQNRANKLTDWSNTAGSTIGTNGQSTSMANEDKTEIAKIKDPKINIKKEDAAALKTRLTNIKKQLEDAIKAIDSLKWGGTAIKDIKNWSTFTSKAGIKANQIGLTNKQLKDYSNTLFKQKFAPGTMPTVQHLNESNYNPRINPKDANDVATPKLWMYLYEWYDDVAPEVEEAQEDQDSAKAAGESAKANALEKNTRYNYTGPKVKHEYSGSSVFTLGKVFTSLFNFIKDAIGEESALLNKRDDLYILTYIMEMFSHATYEHEGQYHLLDAATQKTLTVNNFAKEYTKVDTTDKGKWLSEDPEDFYNKTLTNKQITEAHNIAYCAEIEYILVGNSQNDNEKNVKEIFSKIYGIRYSLNLVSAFQNFWTADPKNITATVIDSVSVFVSGLTSGIIPAPVIKAVILPIITIFETTSDLDRLEAGFPVQIYKTKQEMWYYALQADLGRVKISKLMEAFTSINPKDKPNQAEGMFYSDYLLLFVYSGLGGGARDSMLQRMAEVIQFNIGTMAKKDDYSLKKSRMYFTLKSTMRVEPMMVDLPIFTNSGYTELIDNLDWCTYDINITRGYS